MQWACLQCLLLPTCYVAIYEEANEMKYVSVVVLCLHHFINDGLGVWLHDPDPVAEVSNWKEFQDCLNTSGLKWIFSKQSQISRDGLHGPSVEDCGQENHNLPLCQTNGTLPIPTSALLSCSRSPLRLGVWEHPTYSPTVLWCLGRLEGIKTYTLLLPWLRLPTDPAHSSLPESGGQCQGLPEMHGSGPPLSTVQERGSSPPMSVPPLAIPPCQPLFESNLETLGKLSYHASRPISSESIDQRARLLYSYLATDHCLAPLTQSEQSPVLQETIQPHWAESFVYYQDLIWVIPLIFEQGQDIDGILAPCSKNITGYHPLYVPILWGVLWLDGILCFQRQCLKWPLFFESPFFFVFIISRHARKKVSWC